MVSERYLAETFSVCVDLPVRGFIRQFLYRLCLWICGASARVFAEKKGKLKQSVNKDEL